MPGIYLQITTPQGEKRVPLGSQPLTIGRHATNKLVIGDNMASRFHCVIEPKAGGWVVRDLNSSNGTLLDNKRITESPLNPGHTVLIGSTEISLVDPSKPAPEDDVVELGEEVEIPDEDELAVDMLTEDDVVEVVDDDDAPISVEADISPRRSGGKGASRSRAQADDASISFDSIEADVIESQGPPGSANFSDYEKTIETLADSLPDKPFDEGAISLINARGQVVHPPIAPESEKKKTKKKRDTVDIFRLILVICARARATDVHLEAKADHYQLRIRIDGLMVDVTKLPSDVGVKLSALVKVMSDIDISQRTIVQEGHFACTLPGSQGGRTPGFRRADYRVSFAPAVFGQKLVVRVFDAANAPLKINALQLPDWMFEAIKHELTKEAGMLLVCGPTGSGKTTTLYALVRSSDVARRNVVTIEDPVEVQLEGVTQIQVDDAQGKSFSALLRSVLRQDPDAILVGEIRDAETARIAMQAAITGHLVFSTVHTTGTIGTIFRLLDLGVEPYLVAQGLHLVLAQRLVRQLCQFCKKPMTPTAEELARMGPAGKGVKQIYVPRGCPRCLGTGYAGRRAFFELLQATDALRDVIVTSRTMDDIKKVLSTTKFIQLEQSGYQLVADGAAPIDEIDQAVGK